MRLIPRPGLQVVLALTGVVWLAGLCLGFRSIWAYENAPGAAAQPPRRLPPPSTSPAAGHLTLVLLAHPRCPCTYATVDELAEIMARTRETVRTRVYFYKPGGAPDRWAQTDLWRAAAAIPGVEVFADEGGRTAHRGRAVASMYYPLPLRRDERSQILLAEKRRCHLGFSRREPH